MSEAITKEWTIGEVLKVKPGAAAVLEKYGINCMGCPGAVMETIAFGATMHGADADLIVDEINKTDQ